MTFLAPQLLWALAALCIPVIIHLFNFQRPRRVLFSNVRFLQRVEQSTSTIRKVKHLLVLALRLLAFACLILAFAQPVIKQAGAAVDRLAATSIYIDNSYSMQGSRQGQQALDLALKAAEQLILAGKPDQRYQVLTNEFDAPSQYFYPRDEALDRLRQVKASANYRTGSEVLQRQQATFTADGLGQGRLFWFTDAQKSTLGSLGGLKPDTALPLTVVPVQPEETANLYVDSVFLTQPLTIPGQSTELVVNLRNAGQEAIRDHVIKLFINEVQVSTASATVAAGDKARISFTYKPETNALVKGRISFVDEPISFDNDYHFVINPLPRLRVAAIAQSEAGIISKVFENKDLFDARTFNLTNFDYEFAAQADLLILFNISRLSEGLQAAIGKQTQLGHTVVVVPGAGAPAADLVRAAGGMAMISTGRDSASAAQLPISMPGLRNPFYAGVFETLPQNATLPAARPLYNLQGGSPVLQFNNGRVFLNSYRRDAGNVLITASPMAPNATDFYRHALFVPTLFRAALQSRDASIRLAFSFQNRSISLPLPEALKSGEQGLKLRSGGTELIAGHRIVNNQLIIDMPAVHLPAGYYELLGNGKPIYNLAFNYGRQESQMDFLTREELQQELAGSTRITVTESLDNPSNLRAMRQSEAGIHLWPWLLIAALAALLAETLVLRFWK